MKTIAELQAFTDGLRPHDLSLVVALRELVRKAGLTGKADRGIWMAAVRDAFDDLPGVGGRTERPQEDGGVALGDYLEQQVVRRLEAREVATREPPGDSWDTLSVNPVLWAEIAVDRPGMVDGLTEVVERLLGPVRDGRSERYTAAGSSRLWAEGLTKIYRKRRVVDGVDVSVSQGEIVGLLGPNGAGKTTTFYMIVGLIPPHAGRVHLDEREITEIPMFKRARLGVGYLAQEPSVFRKLSVEDNVRAIVETLGLDRREENERVEGLLQELSITHLRKNKAYSLSGGERRRLEITRALVQRPKFMLLDEPFAGIDPIAVNDIQQIVSELKTRGIGVMISDHNVEQTLEIVDRAYIMYEGRIRVSGSVSELVWNEEVAEIYLGPTLTARMRDRFPRPETISSA